MIVESGGANIASLQFALERLGAQCEVSADARRIAAASHVILPGVGAAADAMARLRRSALHQVIPALEQPVLGICLGMQLLFEASEEGRRAVSGRHSGHSPRGSSKRPAVRCRTWDGIRSRSARDCDLARAVWAMSDYAYFVHSYALPVSEATIATCRYGAPFSACVQWRNFYGVQFHPERSAAVGARLLRNFLGIA